MKAIIIANITCFENDFSVLFSSTHKITNYTPFLAIPKILYATLYPGVLLHTVYSSTEIQSECSKTTNAPHIIVEEYSETEPMVLETNLATFSAYTKLVTSFSSNWAVTLSLLCESVYAAIQTHSWHGQCAHTPTLRVQRG